MEGQKVQSLAQGYTTGKWQSREAKSHGPALDPSHLTRPVSTGNSLQNPLTRHYQQNFSFTCKRPSHSIALAILKLYIDQAGTHSQRGTGQVDQVQGEQGSKWKSAAEVGWGLSCLYNVPESWRWGGRGPRESMETTLRIWHLKWPLPVSRQDSQRRDPPTKPLTQDVSCLQNMQGLGWSRDGGNDWPRLSPIPWAGTNP